MKSKRYNIVLFSIFGIIMLVAIFFEIKKIKEQNEINQFKEKIYDEAYKHEKDIWNDFYKTLKPKNSNQNDYLMNYRYAKDVAVSRKPVSLSLSVSQTVLSKLSLI